MEISFQVLMEYLEAKIRALPELSAIGGAQLRLSFPLFRETEEDSFVGHMVYSYSDTVPYGFVLTPLSVGEPEIKRISESFEILGLTEEDFDRFEKENEPPAKDLSELSEFTIGSFYSLISDPDFDREIYAGYVETILAYIEPEGRKYYRAFI